MRLSPEPNPEAIVEAGAHALQRCLTPDEFAQYANGNLRDPAIGLIDRLEQTQSGAWFIILGHAFWLALNDPRWAASVPAQRS